MAKAEWQKPYEDKNNGKGEGMEQPNLEGPKV